MYLKDKNISISPGPVALLIELASTLSGRRTTVCLEHNETYEKLCFISSLKSKFILFF